MFRKNEETSEIHNQPLNVLLLRPFPYGLGIKRKKNCELLFLTCLILPNSAKCRSFGEGIKLRYSVLPHFPLLLTLTWKRLTLNGLEEGEYHRPWETCTVGIRPFIHHRDLSVFRFYKEHTQPPWRKWQSKPFQEAFSTHVPDILFMGDDHTVGWNRMWILEPC